MGDKDSSDQMAGGEESDLTRRTQRSEDRDEDNTSLNRKRRGFGMTQPSVAILERLLFLVDVVVDTAAGFAAEAALLDVLA
jgi:hypothetical protein